jgi:Protein of unknown function (DUF3467)
MAEPTDEGFPTSLRLVPDPKAVQPEPIYSNFVQGTFTAEDFTIHFSWYAVPAITEPPADGQIVADVKPVARVVVPLNLMKNLIAVLQRQVEGYEQSFGAIPEHPNKPDWLKQAEAEERANE